MAYHSYSMAKIQKSTPSKDIKPVSETPAAPVTKAPAAPRPLTIFDFKVQATIVALLAFFFYINSFFNEFAHDDGIVIIKNEYVQEGFAGLKGIFTEDAYASYYRQLNTVNQLSGGRYRPLSIATFAIEQQFFGPIPEEKIDSFLKQSLSYGIRGPAEQKIVQDMHIRHLFNVFWYMACAVVLLYFLRYIVFRGNPIMALLAAVIFTIHPIHTEVVANVKSRDEIMSLIFMCLTFILAFKYQEQKKIAFLAGAMVSFFLAFLSKEYAITIVVLLPLSFYLFKDYTIKKSIIAFLPYMVVVLAYLYIRVHMAIATAGLDTSTMSLPEIFETLGAHGKYADKEVLNNPYVYATPVQQVATEIATTLNYLKLLLIPTPLSADYSYNSIPYKDFGAWQVWLSIIVHLTIAGVMFFFLFIKKSYKIIGFALAFYLLHLLLINNLIFNIGATMGERLIFHSSVGFAIVIAYLLYKGYERLAPTVKNAPYMLAGLMGVIVLLCGFKTVTRNADWKNDKSLFFEDIKVVPNSVLVNGNVAAAYITMADFEKDSTVKKTDLHHSIDLLNKAISEHPGFVAGFLNKGIAFYKLGQLDSAQVCLDSVRMNYPNYPSLKTLYALLSDYHMKNGWTKYGQYGRYPEAINEFKQGLAMDSTNAELWYNLGGAYFSNKQPMEAIQAWQVAIKLNPNHQQARAGMAAAQAALQAQRQGQMPATGGKPKK